MEVKDAFRKTYKMRRNVTGRNSLVVAMPYEVVEREARRLKLTVDEFIEQYQVVAQYDSFDGVHYTFEKVMIESEEPSRVQAPSLTQG